MIRLTREVRFALNLAESDTRTAKVHNAYAGHPAITGDAVYLRLAVTVTGDLDARSQYLLNIKDLDDAVRRLVIPQWQAAAGRRSRSALHQQSLDTHRILARAIPEIPGAAERRVSVVATELHLSPYQSVAVRTEELPMVRVSSMFEFSAAHRLHNPSLSAEVNVSTFGKCNNPLGHGHNYQVQVTLRGHPGELPGTGEVERVVDEAVIRVFDHKHLNLEVDEFREASQGGGGVIPSVENIAAVAFRRLKPPLGKFLASVTVWETPKTFAEYSE